MTEDRSLDEFAAPDDTNETDPETAPDDTNETDTAVADVSGTDEIEPAVSTSTWTGGGTDCDRCGGRTQRLWRDDGETVCADCKEW